MSSIKNGYFAVQRRKETRSVPLVPILKAHVMSTISERVLRSKTPRYSEAAGSAGCADRDSAE